VGKSKLLELGKLGNFDNYYSAVISAIDERISGKAKLFAGYFSTLF